MGQQAFVAALGGELERAAPAVRDHLSQPSGTRRFQGVIQRLWRRGGWVGRLVALWLRLGTWKDVFSPADERGRAFDMRCQVEADGELLWTRLLDLSRLKVEMTGRMRFDPQRGCIVDCVGPFLEVELVASVEADGAVAMCSGRQWLCLGPLRIRLPALLFGGARTREWVCEDGSLGLSLTLHNPLLGEYLGYEAHFRALWEGKES